MHLTTDHTFWHKWVLLVDLEDKESGAKGYVLISIAILGPGDKIKSPPKLSAADETIDMESNVLQPAGVQLQPTTFTIRIFKAEDLPESKSHIGLCLIITILLLYSYCIITFVHQTLVWIICYLTLVHLHFVLK